VTRQLIIVDVESTGLGDKAVPLEIAAINVDSGEEFHMVPHVTRQQLVDAEPDALRINRYYERGLYRDMYDDEAGTTHAYGFLANMLRGNTLGGSNPAFDARLLAPHTGAVWHHRLADVSAYACARMGLPPTELPGLEKVCEFLQVVNTEPHSALGDARATAECFRRLSAHYSALAVAQF